jgi:hypothetical protein
MTTDFTSLHSRKLLGEKRNFGDLSDSDLGFLGGLKPTHLATFCVRHTI